MSVFFASYETESGEQCRRFNTIEEYFSWLQNWHDEHGNDPARLSVYKAECVYDGS